MEDLKPVASSSQPEMFLSMYEKGYIRCNKALTEFLEIKSGDHVGFYTNSEGYYFFGKVKKGYTVRKQDNINAMVFCAIKQAKNLSQFYQFEKEKKTADRLYLSEKISTSVAGNLLIPITNEKKAVIEKESVKMGNLKKERQ